MLGKPTEPAPDPRGHLLARAAAIANGTETPAREHTITYRVSGGPPTRRLESALEISGTGAAAYRTLDQLQDRRSRTARARLPTSRVVELFGELVASRLLENVDPGGGFIPDSIVGSITVDDATARVTYYFLADEQQRRDQRRPLNPSLEHMLGVLEQTIEQVTQQAPSGTAPGGSTRRRPKGSGG